MDSRYSRPRDLDLIQATPPLDLLGMKAPPRVLTLTEQPLDSLETDPAPHCIVAPDTVIHCEGDPIKREVCE